MKSTEFYAAGPVGDFLNMHYNHLPGLAHKNPFFNL